MMVLINDRIDTYNFLAFCLKCNAVEIHDHVHHFDRNRGYVYLKDRPKCRKCGEENRDPAYVAVTRPVY